MTDHTAAGQTAGYVYQCRYALLAALREREPSPQLQISIEQLDDVAFEDGGEPLARLQTKHHINTRASLTDACPDLWKTLGIWASELTSNPGQLGRIRLVLITTAAAPVGSAAQLLRSVGRDVDRALTILREVASGSSNRSNAAAYAHFEALVPHAQAGLLRSIEVVDGTPQLADLDAQLHHELRRMGQSSQLQQMLQRVEGWWWGRVCHALTDKTQSRISILELESALDDVREGFTRQNLPIDFASVDPTPEQLAAYEATTFVQQVRLVDDSANAITRAKRNYYRAFEQRSRWLRELLIVNDEITRYDKALIEEIEPHVSMMLSELGATTDVTVRQKAGRNLLHWANTSTPQPLRNVTQRFLALGSYHILADDLRVGWHPDFRERILSPADVETNRKARGKKGAGA